MARWSTPEISPWRRRGLTIPPDSWRAWVKLAVWESWMGAFLCVALVFGTNFIISAPSGIVTVFDFTNCYAAHVALPCERVAYRAGALNAMLNIYCGLLLIVVAAWLVWDLWSAAAPKPITDDFLTLLDASFGSDRRRLRTWPWVRIAWAYGFTLAGAILTLGVVQHVSIRLDSLRAARPPMIRVETSERFRTAP